MKYLRIILACIYRNHKDELDFISRKIIQLTNEVDVVSIINNYGRIIWTIIIPANKEPQKFEEVSVSES